MPWATALAVAAAAVVEFGPALAPTLVYDRARILHGEWWRLWMGNWVHLGPGHFWWNLAVFAPAGAWAECVVPHRTRWLLVIAPAFIGVTLLLGDPTLAGYGGLSGLAAGVVALLALTQLATGGADRWFWRSVLGLLAVKIGAEFFLERPVFARFADPDVRAVPLAHVAGVATAAALHCWPRPAGSRDANT